MHIIFVILACVFRAGYAHRHPVQRQQLKAVDRSSSDEGRKAITSLLFALAPPAFRPNLVRRLRRSSPTVATLRRAEKYDVFDRSPQVGGYSEEEILEEDDETPSYGSRHFFNQKRKKNSIKRQRAVQLKTHQGKAEWYRQKIEKRQKAEWVEKADKALLKMDKASAMDYGLPISETPLTRSLTHEESCAIVARDIPMILRKPPDWTIFSTDFKVIDHTGAILEGLNNTMQIGDILRGLKRRNVLRNEQIRVPFILDGRQDAIPYTPFAVVKMNFEVALEDQNAWSWMIASLFRPPAEIDTVGVIVDARLMFNEEHKVSHMVIDRFAVNGKRHQPWPDIELKPSGTLDTNKRKFQDWAKTMKEIIPSTPNALELRAERFEKFRKEHPWANSTSAHNGSHSEMCVVDFGSGYTRANKINLWSDGSTTSEQVSGLHGLPLHEAMRSPDLREHLIREIEEACPSGKILGGGTEGLRHALGKGKIRQSDLLSFEKLFTEKLGDRARFHVLTHEEEAMAEWRSADYALRSMRQINDTGLPDVQEVNGLLSSGGMSCQLVLRPGAHDSKPFCLSFKNMIGEFEKLTVSDTDSYLAKFKDTVRQNIKAHRITGLKGVYILTGLWGFLSYKSPIGPQIAPYESISVVDLGNRLHVWTEEVLASARASGKPIDRHKIPHVLVALVGQIVIEEMFDDSARLCFMGGRDMAWSTGWALKHKDALLPR